MYHRKMNLSSVSLVSNKMTGEFAHIRGKLRRINIENQRELSLTGKNSVLRKGDDKNG